MYLLKSCESDIEYTIEQWLVHIDYNFDNYSEFWYHKDLSKIYVGKFDSETSEPIGENYTIVCDDYNSFEFNYIVEKHIRNKKLNILLDI